MPETPVNKNHLSPAGKDYVGSSWKVLAMQPKSAARPVDKPAHGFFGIRIALPNPLHERAAFGVNQFLGVHKNRSLYPLSLVVGG